MARRKRYWLGVAAAAALGLPLVSAQEPIFRPTGSNPTFPVPGVTAPALFPPSSPSPSTNVPASLPGTIVSQPPTAAAPKAEGPAFLNRGDVVSQPLTEQRKTAPVAVQPVNYPVNHPGLMQQPMPGVLMPGQPMPGLMMQQPLPQQPQAAPTMIGPNGWPVGYPQPGMEMYQQHGAPLPQGYMQNQMMRGSYPLGTQVTSPGVMTHPMPGTVIPANFIPPSQLAPLPPARQIIHALPTPPVEMPNNLAMYGYYPTQWRAFPGSPVHATHEYLSPPPAELPKPAPTPMTPAPMPMQMPMDKKPEPKQTLGPREQVDNLFLPTAFEQKSAPAEPVVKPARAEDIFTIPDVQVNPIDVPLTLSTRPVGPREARIKPAEPIVRGSMATLGMPESLLTTGAPTPRIPTGKVIGSSHQEETVKPEWPVIPPRER